MPMTRLTLLLAAALAPLAAGAGAVAADMPKALAGVAGGLWELSGIPGAKASAKQCVADPVDLAFVEHKAAECSHQILADSGDTLRLSYRCSGAGFGQATIKVVTPRSLRVDVQGIADGAPYAYVMQAHRLGDCGVKVERGH